MNKFVTIVICLLLAEPSKRVFLTLTIICRNTLRERGKCGVLLSAARVIRQHLVLSYFFFIIVEIKKVI